ncbi:MAG: type III-B CRISPR-associated protein Cas10/Cmr2 [Candidatus Nitrosocaldaceae archaeon]
MSNNDFFKKKIAALLHDSPNKPWIISGCLKSSGGHEEDAKSIACKLFENEIKDLMDDEDVKSADVLASSFDRWILSFLMEGKYNHSAFTTKDVKLFNPFYNEKPYEIRLNSPKDYQYDKQLSNFVRDINIIHKQVLPKGDWHLAYITFYAIYEYIWCKYFGTPGPADTRIPTHTVFDHTYATASTLNIVGKGKVDGFMVAIDLGSVQNFIAASRKLRDLWASSWLTSSLAWSIILPFIKNFGPDVLVLPTARGNPFFYHTLVCMLNKQGVKIDDNLKEAAKLAGYEINLGYPQHAVVPATVTLILPSTTSHPDNAKLDMKELPYKLELSDKNKLAEFINELYICRWGQLVESIFETISTIGEFNTLRRVLDEIRLKDSPPLSLRVAVTEIKSDLSSKEASKQAYLEYHKAFQKLSYALREAAGLKVSPSVLLNLTEYTKNYQQRTNVNEPRFYTCSVCGEVPAVPKSLDIAQQINSNVKEENMIIIENIGGQLRGERLCLYCLIKRLLTTRNAFPRVLETLLEDHKNPHLPRFPSVASVAAINFKKAVVDAYKKKPEVIGPLNEVIKSREDISHVAYRPEQELLEQINNFNGENLQVLRALVIRDAEDLLLVGEQRAVVSGLARGVREILPSARLNTYYALIKGDGDDVGKVISGNIGDVKAIPSFENLFKYLSTLTPNKKLSDILYSIGNNKLDEAAKSLSKEVENIQELLELLKGSLRIESEDEDKWKKKLLVSPAYHANLSRSLMILATKISEEVSRVGGFVVYSGGDDVLAVSPVEAALNVILKIRRLYKGEQGFLKQDNVENFVPSLGDLGQSFAITYTHYRYPFSRALAVCMNALEEKAKNVVWVDSNKQKSIAKDSLTVVYVPRGGNQIQATLPFRAKDDQIGELVKMMIHVLEIVEEGVISSSLVKDLDEWMSRISVAYSASGEKLAKKIIEYIVDKNVSRKCDLHKDKTKELLTKGLDLACRYTVESTEERKDDHAKLLLKELVATLQAEIGARRGVES